MDWLGFSRTEANGFLILLPAIVLLTMSEPMFRAMTNNDAENFAAEKAELDSLIAGWNNNFTDTTLNADRETNHVSRFHFDPNRASAEELNALGFSKHLSVRIVNYRQKGGVFRVKRDLMKIYGMDSTLYHQLQAYIQLPETLKKDVESLVKNKVKLTTTRERFTLFDINKADTAQLKAINGIGDKLALRIVTFRESLGGFIDKAQLAEVYGLDTLVVENLNSACFIETAFEPRKINLNTADEKILTAHPYIPKSWAKAIYAYRFQHGEFSDVRDLLKIQIIPPHKANRIIPYLKLKD